MPLPLLDRLYPDQEALERLELTLPTDDDIHQHLRRAHWGELPFLKFPQQFGDDLIFSLRIDPTRPQRDWPVMCSTLAQTDGMTYASSLRTFAVNFLARQNWKPCIWR